jgi:hypothetical protein
MNQYHNQLKSHGEEMKCICGKNCIQIADLFYCINNDVVVAYTTFHKVDQVEHIYEFMFKTFLTNEKYEMMKKQSEGLFESFKGMSDIVTEEIGEILKKPIKLNFADYYPKTIKGNLVKLEISEDGFKMEKRGNTRYIKDTKHNRNIMKNKCNFTEDEINKHFKEES